MKYGSTHTNTYDTGRMERRYRRSKAFAPKYQTGWFGLFFWIAVTGLMIAAAVLVTNL